jgi:PAS domain S-box-containing protein
MRHVFPMQNVTNFAKNFCLPCCPARKRRVPQRRSIYVGILKLFSGITANLNAVTERYVFEPCAVGASFMKTLVPSDGGSIRRMPFKVARFADATNLALISIDSHGNIEFANPSACRLFGYSRSEMIGQSITIIIPERMRGAHMTGLQKASEGHRLNLGGKSVEVSALRKDGSEFPIEITLSVWRDKQGFCAGAVITDISE